MSDAEAHDDTMQEDDMVAEYDEEVAHDGDDGDQPQAEEELSQDENAGVADGNANADAPTDQELNTHKSPSRAAPGAPEAPAPDPPSPRSPATNPGAEGQAERGPAREPTEGGEGAPGGGPNGKTPTGDGAEQPEEPVDPLLLPPDGAELFLGGVPHAATEADIREFCEAVGDVYRLHLPLKDRKDGSNNPGYAFATFMTRVAAARAIEELSGKALAKFPNLPVRVAYSDKRPKNKLYLSNLPRHLDQAALLAQLREAVPGVMEVDIVTSKDHGRSDANRGFGFVEMYNHAAAEQARAVLASPTLKLGGTVVNPPLEVQWADQKNADVDLAAIKSLYVSNLPSDVTEAKLKDLFDALAPVERIALPHQRDDATKTRDYAFVHYSKRSVALQVLEDCHKTPIVCDGKTLTVAMAKPSGSKVDHDRPMRDHGGHRGGAMPPPRGPPMGGPRPPMRGPMPPRDGYGPGYGFDDYGPPPGRMPRGPPRGDPYGPPQGRWDPGFDRPPPPRGRGGYDDYDGYGDDYGYGGPRGRGAPDRGPPRGRYNDGPRQAMPVPMMMAAVYPDGSMMPMPRTSPAGGRGGAGGPVPRGAAASSPATGGYGSSRPATGGYGSASRTATGGYGSATRTPPSGSASSKGYGQARYTPY